ncbi:hypothetical protein [Paenirhodobacter sp.]|uniref:hypothetical protein n=1 Tax=Paenirhodobacter sp. TaxID=1965326 RepID=UPI003B400324
MSIEPIGAITLVLGLLCLFLDYRVTLVALVFTTVFGAAAALFLGAANIPPGHVFLGVAMIVTLTRRRAAAAFLRALHPDRPGFWLACMVVYGIATAFLYPRVMAGLTQIVPLGSSGFDNTGSTVPLGPVSSNFTQSVYMVANLMCFALVAALASSADGFRAALAGVIAYALGNTVFAVLDLATYVTGTSALMDFMRNARYALHTDTEISGLKRIVGAFTEASSFARSSLGVLGVTGTLWLCGYRPRLTGFLALASFGLIVLSTSSTGLAGIPVAVGLLYLTALWRCGTSARAFNSTVLVLSLPFLTAFVVLAALLHPQTSAMIQTYVDTVVLSKMQTDSGVERSSWNAVAMANFLDTGGLGVGLGTIRTSSLATALLAGGGLIGTLLYAVFFGAAFLVNPGPKGSLARDVRTAARNGCLCLVAGDLLISSTIDQGLFFYVLAAIASARPALPEEATA